MSYFVGLDSGGTKTECWLGDEERILAQAVCETVKLTRVSREIATERMHGLLAEVSSKAGVGLDQVMRTCVGVAGYSIAEVREWAWRVVSERVSGEVIVCGDDEIALDAAFEGGPGILVIGGTGAVVIGRTSAGAKMTAGGWGPGIGDEGSGFWIGREAVRRAFRQLDQGGDTGLLEAIRAAWGAKDLGDLVGFANARPGPDFATLAPVVAYCASQEDWLASGVLTHAGMELAEQVKVVWKRMLGAGERQVSVAYTGSVVEKIGEVRQVMVRRINAEEGLSVVNGAVKTMEGAMWRARGGVAASMQGRD
jgi:glucosamine kinase